MSHSLDHLTNDVLPPLLGRISSKGTEAVMADKDYIDPKGYWACPEGGIRRMGEEDGEQVVIVKKTNACSETEWRLVCDALMSAKPGGSKSVALPQFHIEQNRVVIS